MKKITALLLCFLLLCALSTSAFAAEPESETTDTTISVTVPNTHKITVTAEDARVFYEGFSGEEFTVSRLSEPRLLVRAESGKVIDSVVLNGVDATELLHGGYLELDPIYEDKQLVVTTKDKPTAPEETYTISGKVTLNGQPLADVELELRSPLQTVTTDEDGTFAFTDVKPGEHSLTALQDDRVIGYLSFDMKPDSEADVVMLSDGTYTVSVDQNSAGVELHLVLNEEKGALSPADVKTVLRPEPDVPPMGEDTTLSPWWLLLVLSAACIAVLETYRRKKAN